MVRFTRTLLGLGLAVPALLSGCSLFQKQTTCSSCSATPSCGTVVATETPPPGAGRTAPAPVVPGQLPAVTSTPVIEATPLTERSFDPTAPVPAPLPKVKQTTAMKVNIPDYGAPASGFAHTPDYTTLSGELHKNAHTGDWRLRFAPVSEEDRYGGSVTLKGINRDMTSYQSGQRVVVQGQLLDPESRERSPGFRVRDIEPAGATR